MSANSLFRKLLGFRWGPLSFPVSEMKLSVTQDLHEHKYWGVDGASVESVGRGALLFDATIPFRNNIFPGQGEKWSPADLYPTGFRAFVAAMKSGATDKLVHPEFGLVLCKPKSCSVQWSGAKQDGVDVQAQWIETIGESFKEQAANVGSPYRGASLDDAINNNELKRLTPQLAKYKPDFDASLRSILAIGDQVSIMQMRTKGKIDHVAYQVNQINDTLERSRNALNWPMGKATNQVLEALFRLRVELAASGKTLVYHSVPAAVTLGSLASTLKVPVHTLLRNNPSLARSATVRPGRVVKYYEEPKR